MPERMTRSGFTAPSAAKPLPRAWRRLLDRRGGVCQRVIHAVVFGLSVGAAWGLALGVSPELGFDGFPVVLATLATAKAVVFELFRLHRASWRWFALPDAAAITVANTSGSVLGALVLGPRLAASPMAAILVMEWLASQALLLGSRMLYRILLEGASKDREVKRRKRVLLYGAGRRGVNLLRRIRNNPRTIYEIAGFIDDDPAKRHVMIQMTPVLGNGDELPRLARLNEVDEILVAVGSPSREARRRFRALASFAGLPCRFRRSAARARRKTLARNPGVSRVP